MRSVRSTGRLRTAVALRQRAVQSAARCGRKSVQVRFWRRHIQFCDFSPHTYRRCLLLFSGKKYSQEHIRIKGSLETHTFLAKTTVFSLIKQRQRGFTQYIHIKRRIVFSSSRSIFLKNNIKTPVQLIFNRPMFSDGVGKFVDIRQRCDKISGILALCFILNGFLNAPYRVLSGMSRPIGYILL